MNSAKELGFTWAPNNLPFLGFLIISLYIYKSLRKVGLWG